MCVSLAIGKLAEVFYSYAEFDMNKLHTLETKCDALSKFNSQISPMELKQKLVEVNDQLEKLNIEKAKFPSNGGLKEEQKN